MSRIGGLRAQQNGAEFERVIQATMRRRGWICEKIPNAGRYIKGRGFIRQKTPFDFFAIGPDDRVLFFDAKHRKTGNVTRSCFSDDSTDRQAETLLAIALRAQQKVKAGFLFYISSKDQLLWVDAKKVESLETLSLGPLMICDLEKIWSKSCDVGH